MRKSIVEAPTTFQNICVVITTFHPDNEFPERVRRVQSQVGCVVIVDDSGTPDSYRRLRSWFPDASGVDLVHHETNLGVGAALNRGITVARDKGYPWVLTLDDDTLVEPDMVANLIELRQKLVNQSGRPVAIMGMAHRDRHTGQMEPCRVNGSLFVEKRGIITAGSLLSLEAYDRIGPFREEFFIDSVDYDFCLRARSKGYRVVKVCRMGMTHSVGRRITLQIGWFNLESTDHSPLRRYYLYRNGMILAREQLLRDPLYSLASAFFLLKTFALVVLVENNRRLKIRMMWRGLIDAYRHRLGKYPWKN